MNDSMKMFEGVNNVEYIGQQYCEELAAELPVFELTDIPADEWNRRAKVSNTKAFVEKFDRQPKDYDEVLEWVYSLIEDC